MVPISDSLMIISLGQYLSVVPSLRLIAAQAQR